MLAVKMCLLRSVRAKVSIAWSTVALLVCIGVLLFGYSTQGAHKGNLQVTFLDVGQGDAILVETPIGVQVLVDGGKGQAVLRELGKQLSFFDRTIDMVVATHPDLDHIGGLPEVFARYAVSLFVSSGVHDDGADNQALLRAVENEQSTVVTIDSPRTFLLDENVHLDVLFPDRGVSTVEANTGSVVLRLVYGDTSFLLMGDAPTHIESYVSTSYGDLLNSTVLKLGHHGSNTSSSFLFLGYVSPEYAVVSAGCDNPYGHPHKEVLDRLKTLEVTVLDTCTEGSITFESDGKKVRVSS